MTFDLWGLVLTSAICWVGLNFFVIPACSQPESRTQPIPGFRLTTRRNDDGLVNIRLVWKYYKKPRSVNIWRCSRCSRSALPAYLCIAGRADRGQMECCRIFTWFICESVKSINKVIEKICSKKKKLNYISTPLSRVHTTILPNR